MTADHELSFAAAVAAHHLEGSQFRPHDPAHEYYQTSLLSAVMNGVYDGEETIGSLLQHGDFGLGTFNALDGEMIVHEGVAYRLTGDGKAAVAPADAKTPYAAVIPFEPDTHLVVDKPIDKEGFEAGLDELAASPNLFYAIRFTGHIERIRFRSVLRQEKPYKPLLDVVKTQAEFDVTAIDGTILGFRCPNYAVGIGVPGYHLHFLSANRNTGGHVLDYRLGPGELEIDHTSAIHLELPETEAFSDANLSAGSSAGDIAKAEG
ncbi:MAG: acetolactate decarboxylase [Pseudomonadota bacterium]